LGTIKLRFRSVKIPEQSCNVYFLMQANGKDFTISCLMKVQRRGELTGSDIAFVILVKNFACLL